VGTIAMWAALAAFEDTAALKERVDFNNQQIQKIGEELSSIPGLIAFPSQANYMLVDGTDTGKKGDDMIKFALSKGIILRGQEAIYGRDGWWRLTIGTEQENQMLIDAAKEFYSS
jgi:histidinol-phosphate aminotransferase